jgi:hypothetical protein
MEGGKVLENSGAAVTVEDAVKLEAVNTIPAPEPIDKEAEKRLKWKIDLIILPMLCGTFFFSSMVSCAALLFPSRLARVWF